MQLIRAGRRNAQELTVAIADVAAPSARVYTAICHLAGWHVLLCHPDELPELSRGSHHPDVVLFGLVECVRPAPQVRRGRDVPVVLICSMSIDEQSARRLGYAAVLMRPVIPSVLRATVTELLLRHRLPRVPPRRSMIEGEADYRDLMRQLVVQEYDELREASRTLRLEARELCRYAATVRSRASLLGAQHGRPGRSLRR